ncbi:MAG: hypothetical protein ACOCRK_06215 [bacterium]
MKISKKVYQEVLREILKVESLIKKGWTYAELYDHFNMTKFGIEDIRGIEQFHFHTKYFRGTIKRLEYDGAKLVDGFDIFTNEERTIYKYLYKKEIAEKAGISMNRLELINLLQDLENSLEEVDYFMREKVNYEVEEEFYANYEFEQSLSKMAMHAKYIKDRLMVNNRRECLVEQYAELLLEADDIVSNGILITAIEDIKNKM